MSFSLEETHCVAQAVLVMGKENVNEGTQRIAIFVRPSYPVLTDRAVC